MDPHDLTCSMVSVCYTSAPYKIKRVGLKWTMIYPPCGRNLTGNHSVATNQNRGAREDRNGTNDFNDLIRREAFINTEKEALIEFKVMLAKREAEFITNCPREGAQEGEALVQTP